MAAKQTARSVRSFQSFIQEYGIEILLVILGFGLLFMLLWFRLGSLTYGRAAAIEVASQQAAFSWHAILHNPLNAPYTVLQRLILLTGHHGITSMRLLSTAWAVVAIVLFYIVARQWHSFKVALLATWLFISSSWFLHTARLATPEILWLVGILALVVLFSPRRDSDHSWLAFPVMVATLVGTLYVPAMVWLVVIGIILRRHNITEAWEASQGRFIRPLSILGGLLFVVPLVRALYLTPSLVKPWLGVSAPLLSPTAMLKNFLGVPKHLFVIGPVDAVHWLGHLPILSVFEIVMFLLGAYFYVSHLRAARARFIILLSLASWLIIGVGNVASLSLIVPVVYLFVTTGIAYMLHEWLAVFPRNPIARSIGIVVIAIAVLLTSLYQTRSYFVAWRYSPDTAQVFTRKL